VFLLSNRSINHIIRNTKINFHIVFQYYIILFPYYYCVTLLILWFLRFSDKANYKETLKVLSEMGINDPSLVDCANVRYICECVSRRSAHLVSAGLAALLNKMDEKSVTIGVDGSVYRFHPYFHKLMVEKTKQLTKSDIKVSEKTVLR